MDPGPGRAGLSRTGLTLRVAIHGAGSVGCYIGATWALAGLDIILVGRRSVKEEIAANGLTVTDSERRRIELRPDEVDFSTFPRALAKADLIALCVKSHATEAAAYAEGHVECGSKQLGDHVGPVGHLHLEAQTVGGHGPE